MTAGWVGASPCRPADFLFAGRVPTVVTLSLPDPDPGTVVHDTLVLTRLPTGQPESVPVVVAEGATEGPTLVVTGTVHGDEVTATAVCQDIVHDALPGTLAGRVVVVPVLNPAGLRRTARRSYYDDEDPNRLFPDAEYVTTDADPTDTVAGPRPPTQQAVVCRRLFELFAREADAMLDLHTATVDSHPFVIQDRVLYDRGIRSRAEALELAEELSGLAGAVGLPVVFEYPPEEYVEEQLHRSASGAVLNQAGVPAVTVELGTHSVVDDAMYRQGLAGVYRAMEHLGMVERASNSFPGTCPDPVADPLGGPTRRSVGPYVPAGESGIVRHVADTGDVLEAGDPVARVLDPSGDSDSARVLPADERGWLLARLPGVAGYEHAAVAWLAVEDDHDRIGTTEDD